MYTIINKKHHNNYGSTNCSLTALGESMYKIQQSERGDSVSDSMQRNQSLILDRQTCSYTAIIMHFYLIQNIIIIMLWHISISV
jgi:hypothetical protein